MSTYKVEVLRTVATTVEVTDCSSPEEAAVKVNMVNFPLPDISEWNPLDGWEFVVYDLCGNEVLREP